MDKLGNLFIMGDSYSTYNDWIPDGYWCYYGITRTDGAPVVDTVEKTWWHRLLTKMNGNLVMNDSWSGSTICNIRYGNEYCPTYSFVGRIDKYLNEDFFEKNTVDTFLIFGGTNDSWAGSPIGKLQYSNWNENDLKCALPAFCYLLSKLNNHIPNAKIVFIINTHLNPVLVKNYIIACEKYGVKYIQLNDIEKLNGHPTEKGMEQISDQVYEFLNK